MPVPGPVQQPKMDADELTSNTPEHRLTVLKAAMRQVFGHARRYEDCVMSLEKHVILVLDQEAAKGSVWPATESSSNTWKTSRITSSASWVTALEVAELGNGNGAAPSPKTCRLTDKAPPIPERSSRCVKFRLPLAENATVEQSCLSCNETR